jgi:hypothetical protein
LRTKKAASAKPTTVNLAAALVSRDAACSWSILTPGSLTLASASLPTTWPETIYTVMVQAASGDDVEPNGAIQRSPASTCCEHRAFSGRLDLVREPLGVFVLRDCWLRWRAIRIYLIDCRLLGITTASALAAAGEWSCRCRPITWRSGVDLL